MKWIQSKWDITLSRVSSAVSRSDRPYDSELHSLNLRSLREFKLLCSLFVALLQVPHLIGQLRRFWIRPRPRPLKRKGRYTNHSYSKASTDGRGAFSTAWMFSKMLQRRSSNHIEGDSPSCEESSPVASMPRSSGRRFFSKRFGDFSRDLLTILSSAYINVLLIFVPFAISSDFVGWSSSIIFTTNFFSLIPLALLMSYSTRQASKRVGSTVGGLFNITFNNATELIVGIAALLNDEIKLIQTTLLGSILSTLLFVPSLSAATTP